FLFHTGQYTAPPCYSSLPKSPTDGKTYLVQYFERNRLEYHPENKGTPFEVLLGLLGVQTYEGRYGARP
ncbi:MAG: hypothetical protein ABI670_21200, partial [Chloroflexota bacterium]